ncbi:MAG: fumarylacetoacetase [Phycisphaeraceae bacterium]|nr:fumarylacetoacetase [Phycisphaeraceae bacterium]
MLTKEPGPGEGAGAGPRSWVSGASVESDFSLANLPWGVFERADRPGEARVGVAIGDHALDVHELLGSGLWPECDPALRSALMEESLNAFMALGRDAWRSARLHLTSLLADGGSNALRDHARRESMLPKRETLTMRLPAVIGDYTDFYASEAHATNVGSMFRPQNPLMPNWKHLPVGYHGRASSIVVDGAPIRRPMGQTVSSDDGPPSFGPSKLLDYELEMGIFVGPGNALGTRIDINRAVAHLFGMVILNDWSARDVQRWEYQPLGPFNAKNFVSTISPWVVTFEALAPFMTPRPARREGDPEVLPYLRADRDALPEIIVEVLIASAAMRSQGMAPTLISRGVTTNLYWSPLQMLAHHTSTGCNMRPGDLLGTGTISGWEKESRGCLLERTWRGSEPVTLGDGSQRKFLEDGDEVIMRAWCERPGLPRIGFGDCRGVVVPAV